MQASRLAIKRTVLLLNDRPAGGLKFYKTLFMLRAPDLENKFNLCVRA